MKLPTPKMLGYITAIVGLVMVSLTLQTEISIRLDSLVVTEAEAADFADQHRIDRLVNRIEVLNLKLNHAETTQQSNSIKAQIIRASRELSYMLCITDPRIDTDTCLQ